MVDLLLENRKLKAELQIWRARHRGVAEAADHFVGQLFRERRRLFKAKRALVEIAGNEPWLRALNAEYVANTARQAIEDLYEPTTTV